ncbi:hypothetical protein AO268_03835 [Pseudomonas sp. ICMP 8385]|uniref:hypothetical protein n=1 Tax=Pseudomonas sp. ICMP 8385 TaxID=1718920 RepID=UPI000C070C14|nr:hypothetical protein [Pseudomonas sp. ICMP 8385]PHN61226.1 hypothetical protein AO268_03835 [Pseudomonas sp. ICMP 8385]
MTTNQTIDGDKLAIPLTAEQFVKGYCERSGISLSEFYEAMVPMPDPRSPAGWAAVSNNPLCVKAHVELYSPEASKPAAQANGEPVADDHIPVEGMFRIEDTEKERIVWIKGGGFKCSSYDFCHFGENLNFVGLKWEWNGDLKLVMGWSCAPELRVKPEPIRHSQFSLLGGFPNIGGEPVLGPNGWQVDACHTEQATGSASICGDNRELKPASQLQGDPVTLNGKTTIREYVSNSVPEDQIGDDWTKGYEECKRRIHQMFQQPVNAEQPAPVAVVLPARPRADEEEYERMTDYEKGLLHGGIELWDKIDEAIRLAAKSR